MRRPGDNALRGGAGDDLLIGLGGNDTFDGGAGIDTVSFADVNSVTTVDLALTGPQSVGGFEGLDTFVNVENVVASMYWGGTLKGDSGANWLTGGINPSTLMGRGGDDVLDGHNGWQVGAGVRDVITDFQSGLDDIDLTGIDANTGRSGDQGFRFIGTKGFTGKEGELRYQTFDQAGTANDITVVSDDVNGDRIADFELQIVGIVNLASSDFLL